MFRYPPGHKFSLYSKYSYIGNVAGKIKGRNLAEQSMQVVRIVDCFQRRILR